MEFVGGGDLGNLITGHGPLSESGTETIARQLLNAIGYLHSMNIIHRDVKPDNILIDSLDPFVVKLTDFGLSKMVDNEQTFLQTFCGTLLYCAPEVYSEYAEYDDRGRRHPRNRRLRQATGQRYDHAVDIWSLGGVLFYALTGKPPFPARNGASHSELLHQIMTKPLDISPLLEAGVTEEGINFLRRMLDRQPKSRATVESLQKHLWISGSFTTVAHAFEEISEEEPFSEPKTMRAALEPNFSVQMVPVEAFPASLPDFVDYLMDSLPLPSWELPVPPVKARVRWKCVRESFSRLVVLLY
jgi:serine/threonine protein kinase